MRRPSSRLLATVMLLAAIPTVHAATMVTFDDAATSVERLANIVTEAGFPSTQRKAAP